MRLTQLRDGLSLTSVGFGGAQIGNLYRPTSEHDAAGAIEAAWDAGIRYFDTAPHYGLGLSEKRLGSVLAAHPRDDYVLSTKVGRRLEPRAAQGALDDEGFAVPADRRRVWDFSRDGILRSIEESLARLGTDRIDILYLHDCDGHAERALTESADTLCELRDQGVIRAWGAGLNQAPLTAEFIRRCDVDVMMLAGRLTLLDDAALDEVVPLAEERGVGIVAAGVYNSGLLSRHDIPADARYDYESADADLVDRARRLAAACAEYDVELPAAALQLPSRFPAVVSTVVGLRTARQVAETIERVRVAVPPELWDDIDRARSAEGQRVR